LTIELRALDVVAEAATGGTVLHITDIGNGDLRGKVTSEASLDRAEVDHFIASPNHGN